MSSLSAAFSLEALDTNPAIRDLIFAHLRENIDRMTSSASTTTPAKHAFETRVAEVKAPKSDINSLILDYLMMEGYPKAAANFSKEAKLQSQHDPSIQARQTISQAIHTGNIEVAITALNELNPEILDKDPGLHFYLLRLQLVELIRGTNGGSNIIPALDFATNQLGPRAVMSPEYLKDLELTMCLLIFPHESLDPQLAALLHPDLRRQTARQVNEAILMRTTSRREAAIRHLVKMRAWAESSARSKKKDLPDHIELGLNSGDDGDINLDKNSHDPMITT
ncbi:CTLH/CRA C-terminal to lish motif domain-containing protein [Podospora appendiculata]|uniref:CTLH/CRA C-terminal to lish motif domain-containing protein n=1 Tax=Podospora appendiculata TaxID=314037 RepID=A0AAE0X745_9PEZI|nr:CTLH/CRA C-terminal to lish motif domain-containing protein [Podospora appendiculata]